MVTAATSTFAAMAAAKVVRPLIKRRRMNWLSTPKVFNRLKAAVVAVDVQLEHQARSNAASISTEADIILQEGECHGIPRQTLERHYRKFQDVAAELGEDLSDLTSDMVFQQPWRRKPLLDDEDVQFLSNTISYHDQANTGMTRSEIVSLMMELKQIGGPKNWKKCVDHFDYLIRSKKLPDLKMGGRVVAAQATTTKTLSSHG